MAYPNFNMYNTNPGYSPYQGPQVRYDGMQPSISLKGRPVSSLEEARASIIDMDGSIFYFPDVTKQHIYTKQINLDGTSSLSVYKKVDTPITTNSNIPSDDFVSKEMFTKTINDLLNQIEQLKTDKGEKQNVSNNEHKPINLNF